jgi:hypothetical protein
LRWSRSQVAIIVLLALDLGDCVVAWPPAFLCNGTTAWAEWFVVVESLLLIGIVPLLIFAVGSRSSRVRTVAISGGALALLGIGVIWALAAHEILECS